MLAKLLGEIYIINLPEFLRILTIREQYFEIVKYWNIQDLLAAMKSLGLSPTEQEVVDMQCEVEKKGRIFFPDFCKLCLRKFREFDEENFRQIMFKVRTEISISIIFYCSKRLKGRRKSRQRCFLLMVYGHNHWLLVFYYHSEWSLNYDIK